MARKLYMEKSVDIPEKCEVQLSDKVFTFSGPLGEQVYDASRFNFTFELEDDKILIKSWHGSSKKNSLLNSCISTQE